MSENELRLLSGSDDLHPVIETKKSSLLIRICSKTSLSQRFILIFIGLIGLAVIFSLLLPICLSMYEYDIESRLIKAKWWENAQSNSHIIGHDGGWPVKLSDNIYIWTFGDTVNKVPWGWGWTMNSNSGMVLHINKNQTDPETGLPVVNDAYYFSDVSNYSRQIISTDMYDGKKDSYAAWPSGGISVPGDLPMTWFDVIDRGDTTNALGFFHYAFGKGYAHGDYSSMHGDFEFKRRKDDNTDQEENIYSVIDDEKYAHVFVMRGYEGGLFKEVIVARVPQLELSQFPSPQHKCTYYSGSIASKPSFVASYESAVPVLSFQNGQISVAYNKFLGRYMVLEANLISPYIFMRLSENPWGEWGCRVPVFRVSEATSKGNSYCAYFHPELFVGDGQTVAFTFSVMNGDSQLPYLVSVSFKKKW